RRSEALAEPSTPDIVSRVPPVPSPAPTDPRSACPPSPLGRYEFFVMSGLRSRVAWRVLVSPDYCDGSDESCRTDEHDEEGADEEVQCDSPRGRGSEYTPPLVW